MVALGFPYLASLLQQCDQHGNRPAASGHNHTRVPVDAGFLGTTGEIASPLVQLDL